VAEKRPENQKFLDPKGKMMNQDGASLSVHLELNHGEKVFVQNGNEQEEEREEKEEEGEEKEEEGEEKEGASLNDQDRVKALLRRELKIYQKEDPVFYRRFPETLERLQNFTQGNWEIYFDYPAFRTSLPHFLEDKDRILFLTNPSTLSSLPHIDVDGCANNVGELPAWRICPA